MYYELKNFHSLVDTKEKSFTDFLPENVVFDQETDSLVHTFAFGRKAITRLGDLALQPISLISKEVRSLQ